MIMEINGKPLMVTRQQLGSLQLALVLQHVRASEDRTAVEFEPLERQGDRTDEDIAVYEVLQRYLRSTRSVSTHRRTMDMHAVGSHQPASAPAGDQASTKHRMPGR